jgi:hypothetical protein
MKYYIVNFDRKPGASYRKFHDDFVNHPEIEKWFHYIRSSYIIETSLTVDELSNHFLGLAEKYDLSKFHIVIGVDLSEVQGWLTPDAWKWLDESSQN